MVCWFSTRLSRPFNGERIVSSINGAGTTNSYKPKNEVEPYHTPYTKSNSKCLKDLIIRAKTTTFRRKHKNKSAWP